MYRLFSEKGTLCYFSHTTDLNMRIREDIEKYGYIPAMMNISYGLKIFSPFLSNMSRL
jgi:hypothetical protein